MTAVLIDTAQAVADELKNESWSISFEDPVRSYADWEIRLPDSAVVGTLYCDVVPVTYKLASLEEQGEITWHVPVDVCFRKMLEQGDFDSFGRAKNAVVDPLVALGEETYTHFHKTPELPTFRNAVLIPGEPSWATAYGKTDKQTEAMLRLTGQFTSMYQLVYEVRTDIEG